MIALNNEFNKTSILEQNGNTIVHEKSVDMAIVWDACGPSH